MPIRRARRNLGINGVYFMGSSDSIAYNSKSHFCRVVLKRKPTVIN